jgi:hypothetical protein
MLLTWTFAKLLTQWGSILCFLNCIITKASVVKPGDLLETGILIWQSLCILKGKVLEYTLFNKEQGKGVFSGFIDDLIEELQRTNAGISMNTVYLVSLRFADDLTMLSQKKSGLDKMLQTLWEYSNKWQFTFNIKKIVVLTYAEKQEEHSINCAIRKWKLGSLDISEKDTWSNWGKIWDINKHSSAAVLRAVGRGREVYFFLTSLGYRYGGLNPIIASYLWKRIGIPKFPYGSELWKLSKNDLIELEQVQNIMLRIMQGFLPGISGSAVRGLLGMLSMSVYDPEDNLNCYGSPIESHNQFQLGEVASTASASTIVENIQPQRTQVCL